MILINIIKCIIRLKWKTEDCAWSDLQKDIEKGRTQKKANIFIKKLNYGNDLSVLWDCFSVDQKKWKSFSDGEIKVKLCHQIFAKFLEKNAERKVDEFALSKETVKIYIEEFFHDVSIQLKDLVNSFTYFSLASEKLGEA